MLLSKVSAFNVSVQLRFTRSQSTMCGCTKHLFFNASFVTSLVEPLSKIRYDAVSFECRFINRFHVNGEKRIR